MDEQTEGRTGHIFPEVKINKNGYEIRTEVLSLAVDYAKWEFEYKFKLDPSIKNMPSFNDVLKYAQSWNDFINCKPAKDKQFLQEGGQ